MPDIRPNNHEIDLIAKDLKVKSLPAESTSLTTPLFPITQPASKPRFEEYSQDAQSMAYETLSSGEQVAKYQNYLPGTDNNERFAQQQSPSEKWGNGIAKWALKTGTAVIGGTIGTVDSLITGISKGSLNEAYNSGVNVWLDDLNTKFEYQLPNRYTEQEKNASLLGQLGQANFYADKLFGGLSFMTGAVISEAIWTAATAATFGGASTAMAVNSARLAKGLEKWSLKELGEEGVKKVLNSAKAIAKTPASTALELTALEGKGLLGISSLAKKEAGRMYSIGKGLDIIVPISRSTGYESFMEARLYEKQTEAKWLENYEDQNGHEPSSEEYAEFKNKLANSANGVAIANMAILSVSHYVQIGNAVLGKTTARTIENNSFKRMAFGLGYDKVIDEEGKSVLKAIEATKGQKIFGKVYGLAGGFVAESQEEMGQSVVTGTAENYLMAGYDKDKIKTSYGLMDAFHEGLEKTYGSKEGWTEGLVGGLIGVLGGVGGGIMNTRRGEAFHEITNERETLQKNIDYSNGITADMHLSNVIANNRMQYAQELKDNAKRKNDLPGEVLADTTSGIARIERDIAIGGLDEGLKDFNRQVNSLSPEYLMEELGFETKEAVDAYKDHLITEHKALADSYTENLAYAESLVGNKDFAGSKDLGANILQIQRGIAMNLTMGEKSRDIHQDITGTLNDEIVKLSNIEGVTDGLNVQQILDLAPKEKLEKYKVLSREKKNLQEKLKTQQKTATTAGKVVEGEEASVRTARLLELTESIAETEKAIALNEEQKQIALNGIGIEQYTEGTITADMMDNQEANVDKFKSFMKDLSQKNPQKYDKLVRLLAQQSKSIQHIKNYEKSVQAITNKTTRLKTINGWLSSLLNRNAKLKDGQRAYFVDVLESYNDQTILVKQESEGLRNRRLFEEGKEVDPEYIKSLETATWELDPIDQQILDQSRGEGVATIKDGTVKEESKGVSPIELLKEKVQQITSHPYFAQYFGDSFNEKSRNQPKESDAKAYEELLAKINRKVESKLSRILERPSDYKYRGDLGLSVEEIDRLKELNQILGDWQTFQGTSAGNNESVADLLERIHALEVKTSAEETVTSLSEESYKVVVSESEEEGAKKSSDNRGLSTPVQALRTRMANNTYRWSHITKEKFATFFNGVEGILPDKKGFAVVLQNGKTINATYNNRGGFDMPIQEWENAKEDSNILVKNFGTTSTAINQSIGLDSQGNEQFEIVDGDATFLQTTGENLKINEDEVNKIKSGEELDLFVSSTDAFNAETKTLSKEEQKERKKSYHIYVYKNGNLIAALPAGYENEGVEGVGLPLKDLRQNAKNFAEKQIAEGKTGLIKLPYKVEANLVFIGQPNLTLQKDENGEITTKQNNFTLDNIKLVRGQGYIQDGVVESSTNVDVKQFITKLSKSKENAGKKVPFIIFDYNGKNVAFPVDLIQKPNRQDLELRGIFADGTIANNTKIKRLIDTLNDNGINPNQFGLDYSDSENFTTQTEGIEKALTALENVKEVVDVEQFAKKDYKAERLIKDATIAIDIERAPFLTSKIMMKMSSKIDSDVLGYKEQLEEAEKQEKEATFTLSAIALKLTADIKDNPQFYQDSKGDQIEDNYNEIMASDFDIPKDLDFTNTDKNYSLHERARNFLIDAVTNKTIRGTREFTLNTTFRKRLGKEVINEIKRALESFNKAKSLQKSTKSEIKKQIAENEVLQDVEPTFITVNTETGELENPHINETEAIQELGGAKTQEEFEEKLENSSLDYLKTADSQELFNDMSQFNNIPVIEIVNGQQVDKLNTEVKDTLEATLREPENNALALSLSNLEGYNSNTWNSLPEAVKTLIREVEKQALEINVDLRGMSEEYYTKTQEEILNVTRALDRMINFPTEASMEHFIEVYQDFRNIIQEAQRAVVKVDEKFRTNEFKDKIVSLETTDSEYKTFKEQGLLKVQEGVYIKTDSTEKSLTEVENLMATNAEVFPAGTIQGDIKNTELVKEDLNTFVETQMADVLTNDAEYDGDVVKKLIYYKTYFGTQGIKTAEKSFEMQLSQIAVSDIKNRDYLTSDFIAKVKNQQFKGQNAVLDNLVFNDKGITLKSTDIISVNAMNEYLKENEDLRNYFLISKNTNFEVTGVAQDELVSTRDILINGGRQENFKGDTKRSNNNETIQAKTSEDFITVNNENYERVSGDIFVKLTSNTTNFLTINNEKPTLNINVSNYTSVQSEAEVKVNNQYSAKEGDKISNAIDNCGKK